jgi:hypothetical protein
MTSAPPGPPPLIPNKHQTHYTRTLHIHLFGLHTCNSTLTTTRHLEGENKIKFKHHYLHTHAHHTQVPPAQKKRKKRIKKTNTKERHFLFFIFYFFSSSLFFIYKKGKTKIQICKEKEKGKLNKNTLKKGTCKLKTGKVIIQNILWWWVSGGGGGEVVFNHGSGCSHMV